MSTGGVSGGRHQVDPRLGELRQTLARSERRREVLEDVILALGLDLDLEDLLNRVVAIVAAATMSDAGFVYMWEDDGERLVLRAATEGDQRPFLGTIRLQMGEGVTGWSAMARAPVVINSTPTDDPRFSYYPELKEERFRAMLTTPIVVRDDTVVGVFTLYSRHAGHFDDEHLHTAIEVASLLAGAIERAHLRDQDARKAKALAFLGELMSALSSSGPITEIVDTVVAMTLDAMASELCVIVLFEPTEVRLAVRTDATGDMSSAARRTIEQRLRTVVQDGEATSGAVSGVFEEMALSSALRLRELATVPLLTGSEQLGFVSCHRSGRYSPQELQLLTTIADRIALAVKVRRLNEAVLEHSPAWRLHRLLSAGTWNAQVSSLAAALGCDLSEPHMVVKARLLAVHSEDHRDDVPDRIGRGSASVARHITTFSPGSVVHCAEGKVVGLVRISSARSVDEFVQRLRGVSEDLEHRLGVRLSAGLSSVGVEPHGYAAAYREAIEALEIGSSLWGEGRVVTFGDLGPYAYLSRISADPGVGRDPAMMRVARLVEYDQRKGSQLLETLDCYLQCRGNASVAADRLIVHRNTLRQRLARIEELTGVDLGETDDWFPLQLACKLMRLRLSAQAIER